MPKAPRRGCAYQGCPKRAVEGSSYCAEHKKQMDKDYEKYGRHYKTHQRYGRNWKRVRDKYIKLHPICEECMTHHKITIASQVHHRVPISEGGSNSFDNLESVCDACHNRIHNSRKEEYHY